MSVDTTLANERYCAIHYNPKYDYLVHFDIIVMPYLGYASFVPVSSRPVLARGMLSRQLAIFGDDTKPVRFPFLL